MNERGGANLPLQLSCHPLLLLTRIPLVRAIRLRGRLLCVPKVLEIIPRHQVAGFRATLAAFSMWWPGQALFVPTQKDSPVHTATKVRFCKITTLVLVDPSNLLHAGQIG